MMQPSPHDVPLAAVNTAMVAFWESTAYAAPPNEVYAPKGVLSEDALAYVKQHNLCATADGIETPVWHEEDHPDFPGKVVVTNRRAIPFDGVRPVVCEGIN